MLIICVIVMINIFTVNTINGTKHCSCISLLLCTLQGSDVASYHSETIIKFPTNFLGWGMGEGSPFPYFPHEEGHIPPHLASQFARHWRLVPVMSSATMHSYRAGLSALLILL